MSPTRDQKTAFGTHLARLRAAAGYTTRPAFRDALVERGLDVTVETLRGWETGAWAPASKLDVQTIEALLDARGELVDRLGWTGGPSYGDRLDAVEAELTRQRELLEAILARLPAPAGGAPPRRGGRR